VLGGRSRSCGGSRSSGDRADDPFDQVIGAPEASLIKVERLGGYHVAFVVLDGADVRLNQQQLELLDRTIARGEATDRVALIRKALREQAAKPRNGGAR
jgi:hypothetical protein